MSIKKSILKLEREMKEKFPEVNAAFYANRRKSLRSHGTNIIILRFIFM